MASKPNVLILGGLNVCSKSLASYLIPPEGERLVGNLRVIDKFSVAPATCYLGTQFPKTLEQPNVEYRQANLTVPTVVSSVFEPSDGQPPFDVVFDMTGETRHDRPDEFHIKHTFSVSRLCGLEGQKRGVKAYVRLIHRFYETPEKGQLEEKDDLKPEDTTGQWWHESLRTLAAMEDLNLAVLRAGFIYGPYVDYGHICKLIQVSAVYGYMKEPMKALHSPGKQPVNTVHIDDVVAGLWALAQWMIPLGRKQADAAAGETIVFRNDKKKVADVEGTAPPGATLRIPLFNLVDDNDTTLLKAGTTCTAAFGTKFEFYNFITNAMAKFKLEEQVEDINDHHVGAWNTMVKESNPPIQKTPLNPYMDLYDLQKHVVSFSNAKIKRVVGYTLQRPQFGEQEIKEIVDKWREERIWPTL